jgi:cytochrome c553
MKALGGPLHAVRPQLCDRPRLRHGRPGRKPQPRLLAEALTKPNGITRKDGALARMSETTDVPSLAGQPEAFLTLQMVLFRERIRRVEPMAATMRGIRDAEVDALARFHGALPPPSPEGPRMPSAPRGCALSVQYRCGVWHLPDDARQNQLPRLADQREDDLLHAMRDDRASTRQGIDTFMQAVLYGLSARGLPDLAHRLAALPTGR